VIVVAAPVPTSPVTVPGTIMSITWTKRTP
jgi:hypothetical protein